MYNQHIIDSYKPFTNISFKIEKLADIYKYDFQMFGYDYKDYLGMYNIYLTITVVSIFNAGYYIY